MMGRKTRIAIVINTSWNIYNFRLGLMSAFSKRGYEVIAIAPKDRYSKKIEDAGFEFHEIDMDNKGTNPLRDLLFILDLYRLYKKTAPDIVLHYTIKPNIYGSIASYLLGIPAINTVTGLGTAFLEDSFGAKMARLLYRLTSRLPKMTLYQNPYDRELFLKLGMTREDRSDIVAGSGIDTDLFSPRRSVRIDDETIHFLFIARLVTQKGIMEYIEAARKILKEMKGNHMMKRASFSILGSFYPGNPSAITREQMETWGRERIVNYLGKSDNVREIMVHFDCIVLPSYREGLSHVLLEAASMKKPIIASDVPGCRDVIEDGINGFLCKPADSESLAKAMKKILSCDTSCLERMGNRGRKLVIERFREELVVEKYLSLIEESLSP
jgi:glycosyltransferase involved in cell wall biosynthesis